MKNFTIYCLALFLHFESISQTSQISIGSLGVTQNFNDVKVDPAVGSTVNVGYINDAATANGNDCFITKMNADHQIVWQKIISNPGDDVLNKVTICANGDYVVAGKIFQNGVRRGLVCRINSTNGNIIWSTSSSLIQTTAGEEFFDLIETVNQNIAVVGYTNYTPPNTRGIVVLLNSAGQEVYTRISNYIQNSTGFRTVNQLPNNNLLISGLYYIGSYRAVIVEMNELNASVISQNTYGINASVEGINNNINSLTPSTSNVLTGGQVYFQIAAFTGTGTGTVVQCIYEYDQITKNLAGNIYHHNTVNNTVGLAFYPIAYDDLLISQSFTNNTENREFVSRITNGNIVYDRKINGNITVNDIEVNSSGLSLYGNYNNGADVNAYELFSTDLNIPISTTPCNITNADSLNFVANNLSPTANATPLITSTSMTVFTISNQPTNYIVNDLCAPLQCNTEILQTSIGLIGSNENFNDVKVDPTDGSTVNVGYINDGANGNDCFITKMNIDHQIVWQKIISNPGDDVLNKVTICANGDYIVAGKISQNGVRRGLVCRINSTNGNIIWSTSSSLIQTTAGEEFFDLIETVNQNIAVVGYTNYTPPNTRGIVVLLNSAGQEVYTRISNYIQNSTGFRTVNQLPNNNLLISGLYYIGSYRAVIVEMNEINASVISQNTYGINASVAGINNNINSLTPSTSNVLTGGQVYFQIAAFTGTGTGTVVQCIYEYDQTTKNLAGNIYHHNTVNNAVGLAFYPIAYGDLLISQSFTNNTENREFVSRITNGNIVYDRKINGNITVNDIEVNSSGLSLYGNYNNGADVNAYELFSTDLNIPISTCPCNITNADSLNFVANNLSPTANGSALLVTTSMSAFTPTNLNSVNFVTDICGLVVLPVSLIKFTAFYNSTDNNTLLQWSTASEFNSKIFNLEKSIDGGKTFVTFGSVMANGSSNSIIHYNFTDLNPIAGINFYRLKQIDIDGRFNYSNIISIVVPERKSINTFSLYPNPASGFIYISTTLPGNKKITIEITDATGRLLRKNNDKINNTHPLKLEFPGISKGVYFIKLISENSIQTKRVLIN